VPSTGVLMRGWIASPSLRCLVFLLTTWCLNSDAVEVALAHRSTAQERVAAVARVAEGSATIGGIQVTGNHRLRVRDRCDCHRGTVLPTSRNIVLWRPLPSVAARLTHLEPVVSIAASPEPPPPRI
jgi:hypothetical protein